VNWAYAVPKSPSAGDNQLALVVLEALGFQRDSTAPADSLYHFLHLSDATPLIDPIADTLFDNIPNLTSPLAFTIEVPTGGQPLTLSAGAGGAVTRALNPASQFRINTFEFTGGQFSLGNRGSPTSPTLDGVTCELVKDAQIHFAPTFLPRLTFEQSGVEGFLFCSSFKVAPNNDATDIPTGPDGTSRVTMKQDNRHDRLVMANAVLVFNGSALGVDVFPSVAVQPNPDIPITVTIAHQGVSVRFLEAAAELRLHYLRPCFRVTVTGPTIHASATTSGSPESLRYMEPAERRLENSVERLNEFMTYSFEVCFPGIASDIRLNDLQMIETKSVPIEWSETQFNVKWPKLVNKIELIAEALSFDVSFPNLGLPSLTEYEFLEYSFDDVTAELQIQLPSDLFDPLPLAAVLPIAMIDLWTLNVRRPNGLVFSYTITHLDLTGAKLTLTLVSPLPFPRPNIDTIKVKWSIPFTVVSLTSPTLTLPMPLPTVRFRLPGKEVDLGLLKFRARLDGIDVGTFRVSDISADGLSVKLDIPQIGDSFPALQVFQIPNVQLEIGLDLSLPLSTCLLKDLLGEVPSVEFRLSIPRLNSLPDVTFVTPSMENIKPPRFDLKEWLGKFNLSQPLIPFEMTVRMPSPSLPRKDWTELRLMVGMRFNLETLRLADNTLYFFLPAFRSAETDRAPRQRIEFDVFTLTFPNRPEPIGFPTEDDHDGYFNPATREFVIDLRYKQKPPVPPRVQAHFPGGMRAEAARMGRDGVEGLPNSDTRKKSFQTEFTKRFELELEPVDPDTWPALGASAVHFRLNSKGMTFGATLSKTEVLVDNSGHDTPADQKSPNGLIKPFKFQPQEKQRELRSRLVVINNELKEAGVYAKTEVPGIDGLMAEVSVVLRQPQKGVVPDVIASMELERADHAPVAELSIKLMEFAVERIMLGLSWHRHEREWDYSVVADGTIAFTGAAALVKDLEQLRAPSLHVIGLDLRRLNLREMRVPLNLIKPVRFDILDGLFVVELGDLELGWSFEGGIPKPRLLACELAKLEFKNPGAMEVAITVGGLHVEFDENMTARIALPRELGIEMSLGTTARFAGKVGWVDVKVATATTPMERYLYASGAVTLEGFPEIRGLLKFGTGLKSSGTWDINLVLYGEAELDEPLFAGAVVKSFGLGIGLNNQLTIIPPKPSADAIISRINSINPGDITGWRFVEAGGFYLSVVGSVTLASNQGDNDVLNSYIATFIVSIDTNGDLVAAGKCWLSCSRRGQLDNFNNPALVGAMVLSPRQRKLELVLESQKNAYVEKNDLLKKLLDKGNIRIAFRMTPELVDFHLEELSYRDQMFGASMMYQGEYRFAIYRRAVLLKSELSATGLIERSLAAGPGGFEMKGDAHLAAGYGGLLTDFGASAYAFIDASIAFVVNAYLDIVFSLTICSKRYSKTVRFSGRSPRLDLTFRGHIALADSDPFFGFDCQVGINMSICGYGLRASGRLGSNEELYQGTRDRVAAFEDSLNKAVRGDGDAQLTRHAFSLRPKQRATRLDRFVGGNAPHEERWLVHARSQGTNVVALFVPAQGSDWLTPRLASLSSIRFVQDTFTSISGFNETKWSVVFHLPSGFPDPGQSLDGKSIRLAELRGNGVPPGLNASWPVVTVFPDSAGIAVKLDVTAGSFTVNPDTDIPLRGGFWSVDVPVDGLDPNDHESIPYLDDVERLVVRVSDWVTVTVTPISRSEIRLSGVFPIGTEWSKPLRVVVRVADKVYDRAEPWSYKPDDAPEATFEVKTIVAGHSITLEVHPTKAFPTAGTLQVAIARELAPTWNARNRIASYVLSRDAVEYRNLSQTASMWAITANPANAPPMPSVDHEAYAVVYDERYVSDDPRFCPAALTTAPGVLPSQFRPLDDVDIVGADRILAQAKRYLDASKAVALREIHGALDLNDAQTLQQSRATTTQLLVHRLSESGGVRDDGRDEARYVRVGPAEIAYGWLWEVPGDDISRLDEADRVFVRRARGALQSVHVTVQATTPPMPKLLPIRQEFIVDSATDTEEKSRVSVKLPVRFEPDDLRRKTAFIGRYQVSRRVGAGGEEPVGGEIRPEISFLDRPQLFDLVKKLFVDDVFDDADEIRPQFAILATRLLERNKCVIGPPIAGVLPAQESDHPHVPHPLVGLMVRFQEGALESARIEDVTDTDPSNPSIRTITLTLDQDLAAGTMPVVFALAAAGLIVPRPVLISDEFAIVNRRFVDGALSATRANHSEAEVSYSLRPLGEHEPGGIVSGKPLTPWAKPVELFIPPPRRFPAALAMAIPLKSLIDRRQYAMLDDKIDDSGIWIKVDSSVGWPDPADIGHLVVTVCLEQMRVEEIQYDTNKWKVERGYGKTPKSSHQKGDKVAYKSEVAFQLVDISGTAPKHADEITSLEDFRMWADDEVMLQSGFFAGDDTESGVVREPDGETLSLDAVQLRRRDESSIGKRSVRVTHVDLADLKFTVDYDAFEIGKSYRLFFQDSDDVERRSLRRLPILLLRDLPQAWDDTVRYRRVERLEIIPDGHRQSVLRGAAEVVLDDFSADDLYAHGRAAIRSYWPSRTVLQGGVELQFRDFDDSSMRSRTLVEILDEDEFRLSRQDFRNEEYWTLRPTERLERYSSRRIACATEQTDYKPYYLWKRTADTIDAVQRLTQASRTIADLDPASDPTFWTKVYTAAQDAFRAILKYEKSPLNVNAPLIRYYTAIARQVLRALIIGHNLDPKPDGGDRGPVTVAIAEGATEQLVGNIQAITKRLLAHLGVIEQSQPGDVHDSNDLDAVFFDRISSRRLAGIIRRRMAIADMAASLSDIRDVPELESDALDGTLEVPLARHVAWQEALESARSLAGPMPLSETLAGYFEVDQQFDGSTWGAIRSLSTQVLNRIAEEINNLSLVGVVPRAAGLSIVLSEMDAEVKGQDPASPAAILKRPHHEVTTTRDAGGQLVARPTPLRSMLPAAIRRVEQDKLPPVPNESLSRQALRTSHVATLAADGSITIWTTRGEPISKALRPVQHFSVASSGETVRTTAVSRVHLAEIASGPLLLIAAEWSSGPRVELWDAARAVPLRAFTDPTSVDPTNVATGAVFANTRRGLEILYATEQSGLFLRSVEGKNAKSLFRDDNHKDFERHVAWHEDAGVVAGVRDRSVCLWRDLGRPENAIPYARPMVLFKTGEKVIDIQPIMLPAGPHFVVGVKSEDSVLVLVHAEKTSDPVKIKKPVAAANLTAITVDHRELVVIAAFDDGTVYCVSLRSFPDTSSVQLKQSDSDTTKKGTISAILHTRDGETNQSTVLVARADETDLEVNGWLLRFKIDGTFDSPIRVQYLPGIGILGSTPTPAQPIVAIATKLVTARSAAGCADLPCLFHIWERLGFAVDVAAQDATTRLLTMQEMDRLVDAALSRVNLAKVNTGDNGPDNPHWACTIEAEEPDAEFRDSDRVGFSHRKIAIVPVEFLAASLAPITIRDATRLTAKFDYPGSGSVIHLKDLQLPPLAATDPTALEYKLIVLDGDFQANSLIPLRCLRDGDTVQFELNCSDVSNANRSFSAKVAILRGRNLEAPAALKGWLTNRGLTLAQSADEELIELAYVTHLTRLAGVPTDVVGQLVVKTPSSIASTPEKLVSQPIRLQPSSDRFVRVPASATFAHWSWTLPDRKGHRMMVAARRVSRYEPLLRWWLNRNERFDIPDEVPLTDKSGLIESHKLSAVDTALGIVKLANPLVAATRLQPLRLAIVQGTGAGQHREVERLEADTFKFTASDPWAPLPTVDGLSPSLCQVLHATPGWRMVVLDPIHDPALGEGPQPLTVYQYPHARKPRFSFQIPLEGMRSSYNQISRVRTGYHGVETAFRYLLPDRVPGESTTLSEILGAVVLSDDRERSVHRTVTAVTPSPASDVTLFRHERLVSLPDMPHYYRYRLDVRSVFRSRLLECDRTTRAERLPDDENLSPLAERFPSRLALFSPTLRRLDSGLLPEQPALLGPNDVKLVTSVPVSGANQWRIRFKGADTNSPWSKMYSIASWIGQIVTLAEAPDPRPSQGGNYEFDCEIILFVAAHHDHLTREETESEPSPIVVDNLPRGEDRAIPPTRKARFLPDVSMEYRLSVLQFPGTGPMPSLSDIFLAAGSIHLPWSPEFRPPDKFPKNVPIVTLSSGLQVSQEWAVIPFTGEMADPQFYDRLGRQYPASLGEGTAFDIYVYPFLNPPDRLPHFADLVFDLGNGAPRIAPPGEWTKVLNAGEDMKKLTVKAADGSDQHQTLRVRVANAAGTVPSLAEQLPVPLRHNAEHEENPWLLRFRVEPTPAIQNFEPANFFVHAKRDGHETRAARVAKETP